ncbi:MAG TPA: hypothetical protein VFJ95_09260, partial [Gammaproteobacteria bacterium]|nr:hypothetical protein [Gammaproteobacteria bacterium]
KHPFRALVAHTYIVRTLRGTTTMKATEVRILPALEPGESYVDPLFVLVETALDDSGDTVTTIDHVSTALVDGRDGWHVTTLAQSVPMTHAAALEWAVSYAASRNVPIVFERDSTRAEDYAASLSGRSPGLETSAASSASK